MQNNGSYRFRTINTGGVSQCPIEINVQKHHLTVISIDGHAIEPKPVDVIQVEPGLVLNKHIHLKSCNILCIQLKIPIWLCV